MPIVKNMKTDSNGRKYDIIKQRINIFDGQGTRENNH